MNFQEISKYWTKNKEQLEIVWGHHLNTWVFIYFGWQNTRLLSTLMKNLAMYFHEIFREVDHGSLEQLVGVRSWSVLDKLMLAPSEYFELYATIRLSYAYLRSSEVYCWSLLIIYQIMFRICHIYISIHWGKYLVRLMGLKIAIYKKESWVS